MQKISKSITCLEARLVRIESSLKPQNSPEKPAVAPSSIPATDHDEPDSINVVVAEAEVHATPTNMSTSSIEEFLPEISQEEQILNCQSPTIHLK